jgi:hypothetical protein
LQTFVLLVSEKLVRKLPSNRGYLMNLHQVPARALAADEP